MNSTRVDAIRRAVASGEFLRATRLWNEYAGLLQDEIARGACTRADMAEARELVEWSRRTVRLAQAHAQCRLNALHAAEQYSQKVPCSAAILRACL